MQVFALVHYCRKHAVRQIYGSVRIVGLMQRAALAQQCQQDRGVSWPCASFVQPVCGLFWAGGRWEGSGGRAEQGGGRQVGIAAQGEGWSQEPVVMPDPNPHSQATGL